MPVNPLSDINLTDNNVLCDYRQIEGGNELEKGSSFSKDIS